MTSEQRALRVFKQTGAIGAGHFVGTSGRHLSEYINKDALYPHTKQTSRLCRAIALEFADEDLDAVIGPEKGGIILSQWTAYHLTKLMGRQISAVYAEKEGESFVIKRGYDKLVSGRLILVVEDVLTTGGSAGKVVEAVRENGGGVVGVGALWNRGGVTTKDIGDVPRFHALINKKLADWSEEECLLTGPCSKGMPINTDFGKGRISGT